MKQDNVEIERLRRRNAREREARKVAERLLEQKSRELFASNHQLQELANRLEEQVQSRTLDLQQALVEAEVGRQAKGNFLAVMSHEIRTPLNGILGTLDLFDPSDLSLENRAYLEVIRRSGDHLLRLINDILDFSKIEFGQIEVDAHPIALREELVHLQALFSPVAMSRELNLELVLDDSLPNWIAIDGLKLRQILSNLISNALKFTEKGSVRVCASGLLMESGAHWRLQFSVVDSGIGISPEQKLILFQPFTQLDIGTTRKYGGTGLGLTISSQLVKALGGNIEVISEVGKGTEFRFEVEAGVWTDKDVHEKQSTLDEEIKIPEGFEFFVLLAEDDQINQMLGQAIVRKLGCSVDLAIDGRQAVSMAAEAKYHLILMDMQMPEMDGMAATRAIRTMPLPRQPRIVALTANAFSHDRQACLSSGMDEFITKPLKIEQIRTEIKKTLEQLRE